MIKAAILLGSLLTICHANMPAMAFWIKQTEWPTNWGKFKYPPPDIMKPYVTVKFTKDTKEACNKYYVALQHEKRMESRHDAAVDHYLNTWPRPEFKKFIDPYHQPYWRAEATLIAAGAEVLRQFGDPDWKNYSLYSDGGVGEKWREGIETKRFNPSKSGFAVIPYSKIRDICNTVSSKK